MSSIQSFVIHFQSFLFYMKIVHRLLPGEALTFNNRRVLHSRTPMKLNGGVRHLQVGGYPSWSNTSSIVFMRIHHSWEKQNYCNVYATSYGAGYISLVFALWIFMVLQVYLSVLFCPQGVYVNIDIFKWRFQVLTSQLHPDYPVRHVFNQCSW